MRSKIIETAKKRFVHYGYAKTTMAEIAADLNMSPGNLYRYFPGKIDIAEALADETLEAAFEKLREVASREGLTSREKLRSFLQLELTWTYHQLDNDPRIFEIAQFIKKERPHHVNRQLAGERKILSALLAEGVRSGEFQIADVEFSAEMIQSATMKFRYPQLWSVLPLDKLTRELDGVFSLIVDGLTPRAAQAPAAAKSADPLTSLPQMVSVTY